MYQQGLGFRNNGPCRILVDRVTGVNYLYYTLGNSGGLTPLLDANGKPVVTPVENL
ncbi:MAG: xylan 1,4-beta-xylosidase [Clostridia bacterium]|nr:xylan 1,4-beta-xylosidase [Clostridia bacterium]